MSAIAYTPGAANAPYGNLPLNPQGSNYAQESGFTTAETILIAKAVQAAIFDTAPARYDAMKILMMKPFEDVNNDEFEYLEMTFGRTAVSATAIVAAVAAVPGAVVTQVIPMTAQSVQRLTPDLIIVYPNNTKAVVRSIAGLNVTVASQTSNGLPAVAANDVFPILSSIEHDGAVGFQNYERTETVTRYNYVQLFARARRWSRMELQKHINSGTTDYLNKDKEHQIKQLRIDMFNAYWNGNRGEYQLASGVAAKAMGGVYPTMIAAGSAVGNPTLATLQTVFEQLAFATNFKVEGGTRFIYGTAEMLNELSKIYKQPGLRYTPNDTTIKLDLQRIEVGGMNFVLVPCELWREQSCFGPEWRRRLIILDQDTITPTKVKGMQAFEVGETPDAIQNQTLSANKDWWVKGQMGLKFNNPLGSFIIDLL